MLPHGLLQPRFAPLCQVGRAKKRLMASLPATPCFLNRALHLRVLSGETKPQYPDRMGPARSPTPRSVSADPPETNDPPAPCSSNDL